ncbi:hypothetical protein [Methanothermobacter sp.]|uniref:hypothetical protein n=1 Tax=Methanothermobacter sp. TaxID=1884223 RepID=UPI00263A1C39|nr:hypothetical protein [Methanothermobacter sp.]MDI9615137.1 hypothetical protein [Methanothermobacter sp.]
MIEMASKMKLVNITGFVSRKGLISNRLDGPFNHKINENIDSIRTKMLSESVSFPSRAFKFISFSGILITISLINPDFINIF